MGGKTPDFNDVHSNKTILMVMPVYNEIDNIQPLVESFTLIRKKLEKHSLEICFVDDNSPDGTGKEIKKQIKDNPWIYLLERKEKNGLGEAYLSGFRHVLERYNADYIGQMDSDLSHDPNSIFDMASHLEEGSQVVIGSRYVSGGRIEGWPLSRRIISRGGNTFARYVGGLKGVKDCTSGFRIIRSSILKDCIKEGMIPTSGYSFLIHLLHSLISKGCPISEVPIVFRERIHGESKLGNGDIIEFITSVSRLRFK